MKIVVAIKQVPKTDSVKIDEKTNNLVRNGVEGVINQFDKNAIEAALQIKDETNAEVIALSMGPNDFETSLRGALAMGADSAVLLSSRAFAGADTLATAAVLASAIKKIGDVDLVVFGRQAVDADTGQVGPIVADKLDLPQITYASSLRVIGDSRVSAVSLLDHSEKRISAQLPAVVTVRSELNKPRYATPRNIMLSFDKDITVWSEKDLDVPENELGQAGSPTIVTKVYSPEKAAKQTMNLEGDPTTVAEKLISELSAKNVL
ncbi:electron transfer flavoprotein subunit beta/FixA family protein [Lentilactobacillus sp. Marseille-Q4993]|uniref:electron transfer flavoprotein subunit beta/FixA family protein n=1 Tax=Lentilactobacillus sp. Marseille-Q4993 TaxID=3039492 RepID=UPI0024BD5095|nr:electron transfer flavoprotein subunit beta/FixA family protein [Lentilactobacillus sp. Marseille-Q4993]